VSSILSPSVTARCCCGHAPDFAVEEFPAVRTLGAWMQVGDHRYESNAICRLAQPSPLSALSRAKVMVATLGQNPF
jgi:hypothetical protein